MTMISEDRLRGYIARCREMSEGGKFTWWSELADILESLTLRNPPSGEAGEVTDEMVERAMAEAGWLCEAVEPTRESGVIVDPGMSQEDADDINRLQRSEMRRILEAALPTIKEPTEVDNG